MALRFSLRRVSNVTPKHFYWPLLTAKTPLCSLCLGLFMAMMDASIVATSLYTIGVEFNELEHINWIALAYTLAFLGCSVFFASMADVVGRRNAFVAAFILFLAFLWAAALRKTWPHSLLVERSKVSVALACKHSDEHSIVAGFD